MSDFDDPVTDTFRQAKADLANATTQAVYLAVAWRRFQEQRLRSAAQETQTPAEPRPEDRIKFPDPPAAPTAGDRLAFADPVPPGWSRDQQRRFDVLIARPGAIINHTNHGDGMIVEPIDRGGTLTVAYRSDNPHNHAIAVDELTTQRETLDQLHLLDNNGQQIQQPELGTPTYENVYALHPEAIERWEGAWAKATADHALAAGNDARTTSHQGQAQTAEPGKRDQALERADVSDGRADTLKSGAQPLSARLGPGTELAPKPDPARIARHQRQATQAPQSPTRPRNFPERGPRPGRD